MTEDPEKLLQNVRRVIDEQNTSLDGATLSRLNVARQRALMGREKKKARLWGWSLAPVAGTALLVFLLWQPVDIMQQTGDDVSDLQILTGEESLEFFQEDMAFYEWIEEVMENESVHNYDNDSRDDNNELVSSDNFRRGPEQSTTRRTEAGWRAFRVSWLI